MKVQLVFIQMMRLLQLKINSETDFAAKNEPF